MSDDDKLSRTRTIFRLHCLSRLAKLQAKLEQPDWEMSVEKEIGLLSQIQTGLTLVLHDLGIKCYIAEDWETSERVWEDRKS